MLRVIGIIVAAAVVLAVAWFVASLPGQFSLVVQGYTVQMPTPLAVLALVVLVVAIYLVVRLFALLVSTPRRLRRAAAERDRRRGDQAVTGALSALAARDGDASRREAARARRLLGDTPQTLLLAAYAGQISNRDDEAATAFALLADRRDSAFLGLRGLIRRAIARQDWDEAAALARRAEAARPRTPWLAEERARLASRNQAWGEVLSIAQASADAPLNVRAAYATAAADAEPDSRRALKLARQAWETEPALAPAALGYARRLRNFNKEKQARAVLARSWELAPQPELATLALAETRDPMARLRSGIAFTKSNTDHPESQFLLARLSLEAGLTGEARRHAGRAQAAGMNQRRLHVLLADIAEADGNDTRSALRDAASADPDPTWRCSHCGTSRQSWAPVCTTCQTPGEITWTGTPLTTVLPAVTAEG